ncbi:pyridoxamine 5'-phosphate oxidase family protein [Pararobbsia silviterrae]|uniref:2Fe-2S iron-sulfur cluster-binding protein n=1 Tax=Pararobbsia silviterrae TaxID=1792498 RepID=UPI001F0C481C|nr:pyridoxamine 5'-phosphate oxidase family protein [Pararobbsia silviterrae]
MNTATESRPASPWHAGELELQRHAGVVERMDAVGRRSVRDQMPDQHREFFAQLPFVVAGSVAPDGTAWATLIAGRPGFLHTPTPRALEAAAMPALDDPARAGWTADASIALLGIELHTRRRNRLNGVLEQIDAGGFRVGVRESFGNCPQYIQLRDLRYVRDPGTPAADAIVETDRLTGRAEEIVRHADTFFVASYVDLANSERKVDVSHRGGKPGFVRIGDDGVLTVPDFAGNQFFSTLGNFRANPRAGLVFADFETGDLVQLTGTPEVVLDSPEIAAFQGAERLWRFAPERVVYRRAALPFRLASRRDGASPNASMTGDWASVEARLRAAAKADAWRPFRVARIVDESTVIRSLHLEPLDGAGLAVHAAGQHLPIRVMMPGATRRAIRTYTLSTAPSDGTYRISVKREGVVSRFLHEAVRIGDTIDARAPAGTFTIDAFEKRPAVLLAAGVGITPMIAMLRHVVYEGLRKRRIRPTWLFQSAHSLSERAFSEEIAELVTRAQGQVQVVRLLSDPEDAEADLDYDIEGRLDITALQATLPFDDFDFYLCGPGGFMQSVYDGLRALNISDARLHAEAFGPSGLVRDDDRAANAKAARSAVRARIERPANETANTSGHGAGRETVHETGDEAGHEADHEADHEAGREATLEAGHGLPHETGHEAVHEAVHEATREATHAAAPRPATQAVTVSFAKTKHDAQWAPASGTLLDLAETSGLAPEFGCRSGTCGTCRTRIVKGAVAYPIRPTYAVDDGEALICCAVPAQQDGDTDDGDTRDALVLDL